MRLSSYTPFALLVFAALGCAVACGDDDDDSGAGKAGSSGSTSTPAGGEGGAGATATGGKTNMGGKSGSGTMTEAGGGAGGAMGDSAICTGLGGPANIDMVVRGDSKVSASDPFNGFKFTGADKKRDGSVLLNVATDGCISQQFAHLLVPAAADQLEHLAECLSLYVQNAAGCDVPYVGSKDKKGKACKDMKTAHTGLGVSEADYVSLVTDAATALLAAGVKADSPEFLAVAGALTSDDLKADVITNDDTGHSQPIAGMCVGEGGAPAAGGAGGAGGAP